MDADEEKQQAVAAERRRLLDELRYNYERQITELANRYMPLATDVERRALALKYALDGKTWVNFTDKEQTLDDIIAVAERFEQYISTGE